MPPKEILMVAAVKTRAADNGGVGGRGRAGRIRV